MLPVALAAPPPAAPALVVPVAHEVSFGRIAGRAAPGTQRILVLVDGRLRGEKELRGRRFTFSLELPRRNVTVRVTAVDGEGRRASTVVQHVYGLPRSAEPRGRPPPLPGREDPVLARTVRSLARGFPGICSVFVQDLRTGAGAAWNARARFPAASTLKLAIAVEILRTERGTPAPGSRLDTLLRRMLVISDSKAANELLVRLGGSTSGGSARVNSTLRSLGLNDTDMYGGYEIERTSAQRAIPIRRVGEPSFVGKRTTAWDLARLARHLHFAADGNGLLARRLRGAFSRADARYLLYVLAHVREPGRLDRFLGGAALLHKAGWIRTARHDNGLVYWPGGAFVVTVMTWRGGGIGTGSDVLAGRVARAALDRFSRG